MGWQKLDLPLIMNIILECTPLSVLSESLVTTAWGVLRMHMEQKAARFGG
jgi:hypothetical protein